MKRVLRQLVIIGAGIMGRMLALMAGEAGFKDIVVYDAPDQKGLGPDSLRNHAWWQSGLLYAGSNRASAIKMYWSGRSMFEKVGIDIPDRPGVFRFSEDNESERVFKERAKDLRLENRIQRIDESNAKRILGGVFQEGFIHYFVPDTPFDEAAVVRSAQYIAESDYNISFCKAKVRLVREPTSTAGYLIDTGSEHIESQVTVLCAGAGMIGLLEQLNITHPLVVYRSGLLRIREGYVMQTPLLVDISTGKPSSGMSVIQHTATSIPPKGCLVIGSKARRKLSSENIKQRIVTYEEDIALQQLVPPELIPTTRGPDKRVIAGYKTEAELLPGKPSIDPWIQEWPDQYPGLIGVVPGKATLAFSVATRIINKIGNIHIEEAFSPSPPIDPKLDNDYRMHHDGFYDGILDEIETTPRTKPH